MNEPVIKNNTKAMEFAQRQHVQRMHAALDDERKEQYARDLDEALRMLTLESWRVFSLRWGLSRPPFGWHDALTVFSTMHRLRLLFPQFSKKQKRDSAKYLTDHGVKLPGSMSFIGGVLTGNPHDVSNTNIDQSESP